MTTQSKFIKHYPQKRRKQEAKKLDKNNMLTEQIKMMQQQMKKI